MIHVIHRSLGRYTAESALLEKRDMMCLHKHSFINLGSMQKNALKMAECQNQNKPSFMEGEH